MLRRTPMLHRTYLLAAMVWFGLWTGCGGSRTGKDMEPGDAWVFEDTPPGVIIVETSVSATTVKAGESFDVQCKAVRNYKAMNVEMDVELRFGEEVLVHQVGECTLEKVGTWEIACRLKDGSFKDLSPVKLEVQMGKVVRIETTLNPTTIRAGEESNATCTAFDAYGNSVVVAPGVNVEPAAGVTVNEQTLIGNKAGTYEVRCKGEKGVEVVPATLVVEQGVPAKFVATVTPDTVEAGKSAQVSCEILDKNGNPVDSTWKIEAPEELTVQEESVSTTKVGSYKIKCGPTEDIGKIEQKAATLTVVPGAPVEMHVYPKPHKDHYSMGDQVTIKHELVDEYDNVIGDADIEPIAVDPPEGMVLVGEKIDRFVFKAEGWYHVEVKAVGLPLSGELDLLCDSSGPVITVTWPPRGHTATGPASLVVTGMVEDAVSGVEHLVINEQPVEFDAQGGFSFPMSLGHGMNMISFQATDGVGNVRKSFRSVFYSTKFAVADRSDPTAGMIEDSIIVFLSQEFIDDGDHSMPPDDLATIIEKVVAGMDIASMLPQEGFPVGEWCSAQVQEVTLGTDVHVDLQSVDGGLHMIMSIPDLNAKVDFACCAKLPFVGEFCQNAYIFIYAQTVVVDAYVFISVDESGSVQAEMGPVEMELVGLDVDVQGILGNLFDPLVNAMVGIFKEMLEEQITKELSAKLPAMVEDALNKLAEGQVFEVPPFIGEGDPVELLLSLKIGALDFSYDGMKLVMDGSLTAYKGVEHSPLGVLLRDGCMGTETEPFVLVKDNEMNAALAADFAAEALYSLWYSGALTLDLSQEDLSTVDVSKYGIENLSVRTDFHYAPVIESCGTGEMLEIQIGDGFVHTEFDMMGMFWDIDVFIFLAMDAAPKLIEDPETGELLIGIDVAPELKVAEVDIVRLGEDLLGKESMVEELFKGALLPMLTEQLVGGLGGFAVPGFDLSTMDPSIPEGTTITVGLEKVMVDNGYLVMGGKLK